LCTRCYGHCRKRKSRTNCCLLFTNFVLELPPLRMTTYSAFFSSGLLAPHHAYFTSASSAFPRTPTKQRGENYLSPGAMMTATPSPARPSSPLPIPDDSDVEFGFDMDVDQKEKDRDNDVTPTQTHRGTLTSSSNIHLPKQQPQPRLRKRRSSITLAASPMNAIRSPARMAGAALQLQRHLPPAGGLGARSRSGSLVQSGELEPDLRVGGNGMRNVACESTSLVGRMRSGSVGSLLRYLSFSSWWGC
jgi:hypothetical protein